MFVSFFFFLFRRYDSRSTRKKGVCYTNVRRFLFFSFSLFFPFFFSFFSSSRGNNNHRIVSYTGTPKPFFILFYFFFFFQRSFLRTRSQPIANIRYIMPMPVPFSRYPFLCNSRQRYTLLIDYLIIIYTHEILECK